MSAFSLAEVAVILILLAAAIALGIAATQTRPVRQIDPRALLALDEAGAYLRNLAGFDVRIETEVDHASGPASKHLDIHSRYRIKWPDVMYAELGAEGRMLKFYFYGGEFTVFSPNLEKYIRIKLPPLLRQAMDFIYWRSGFRVPLARLIYFDSKSEGQKDLTLARRVGDANIDGVECGVYAFRQGGLELKVWIRSAPAPLPVRLEIRDPQWHHGSRHISTLDWTAYAR
jgi:hypothetical protein